LDVALSKTIFISGVSSGVGLALARLYVEVGHTVYGLSRREPADLCERSTFHFVSVDLRDAEAIGPAVEQLLSESPSIDLAVLNAGVLGGFGDLADSSLADLKQTMQVNMWANKQLLDALFTGKRTVGQVVGVSSGAAVNGIRGWGGYSISKAALNMLIKIYAKEQPATHFTALAPGLIDTAMQEELRSLPPDERFPSVEKLRAAQHTPNMPSAEEFAPSFAELIARLPTLIESGEFGDIRSLEA